MQGCTAKQGSINLYLVSFGTTTLLSTAGLISIQVYVKSTSQEKKGTVYMMFDIFNSFSLNFYQRDCKLLVENVVYVLRNNLRLIAGGIVVREEEKEKGQSYAVSKLSLLNDLTTWLLLSRVTWCGYGLCRVLLDASL